jgi:hypothetical protein
MEIFLIIAAVALLLPFVAIWADDERDHLHPKPH